MEEKDFIDYDSGGIPRCSECSRELSIDEELHMKKRNLGMCQRCLRNYGMIAPQKKKNGKKMKKVC